MQVSATFALLLSASQPANALLGGLFKGKKEVMVPVAHAPPASVAKKTGPRLPPTTLDNKNLDYLFEQNQQWKATKLSDDKEFFNKLGTTHTPEYMYIGCVDARVPENFMMGEEAGNIFVQRNVANLVVNNDMNLLSALQYGVGYLKVKDIIVCGHYECGGMRAAESAFDHQAPLETWLRNIRDVYRLHKVELDAISDPDVRHRRFVELNVIEQCVNVFKSGIVQQRRKETYLEGEMTPRIHAMVFDPKSGDLKRIPFDFTEYSDDLNNIYGMYQLN